MKRYWVRPIVRSTIAALTFCGVVAVRAQPSIEVQILGSQTLRLSWPANALDFQLERTASLSGTPVWETLLQIPRQTGNEFSLTVNVTGEQQFFRLRQTPLAFIRESSPVNGEQGVAVTRETIVRFSSPLAANTTLTTDNFYATFAGRRILSRAELSSDRQTATLFYLEPLPGRSRIKVFFDAAGLKDYLGRPLDPAGTGQPNGFELIQFDTLSVTPLAGTAVIGRVFASELQPGSDTGANAVNKPLAGVTITVDGMEQTLRTRTDAKGTVLPPIGWTGGGSGLWWLAIHELRFKSNRGLIAQGTGTSALVIPALEAGQELLAGGRVIGGHLSAQHFVFDFTDGAFHPGVVRGIARATHAGDPAVLFQEHAGLGAGILHAAI